MVRINTKIDRELKRKMEKFKHINLREIVSYTIKRELETQTKANQMKTVFLSQKIRKKTPEGFNSEEIIRRFREARN